MTVNDLPSKERTRDILMNWRRWAQDCEPDPAEVYYYTVSPMFAATTPRQSAQPYDSDSALMVEEVLRVMVRPYPSERWLLIEYFGKSRPQIAIAKDLGIRQQSVSRHRLPMAERIFAEQWGNLIR